MKILGVIPARGGSKRIARKNIIDFNGAPLISWTIKAAQETEIFTDLIVSTDDFEISEISKRFGIDVPFLRDNNSDDVTPVSAATISALAQAENHFSQEYDVVVQLMANCPVRVPETIKSHVRRFIALQRHFQISCFKYGWMNPWWAHSSIDSTPTPLFPEALKSRSQDLPSLYCPTGSIWVANRSSLLKQGTFYGEGFSFEPMPWEEALDIDDEDDLRFARVVHETYLGNL